MLLRGICLTYAHSLCKRCVLTCARCQVTQSVCQNLPSAPNTARGSAIGQSDGSMQVRFLVAMHMHRVILRVDVCIYVLTNQKHYRSLMRKRDPLVASSTNGVTKVAGSLRVLLILPGYRLCSCFCKQALLQGRVQAGEFYLAWSACAYTSCKLSCTALVMMPIIWIHVPHHPLHPAETSQWQSRDSDPPVLHEWFSLDSA